MDTASTLDPPPSKEEARIGFLGVFASPALENAFRNRRLRDDRWLSVFLVSAGMLRIALFLLADYHHFGVGPTFWLVLAGRLVFLLVSAWVLVGLLRAACPAAADRLLFTWGFLIVAMTVCVLASRPPGNHVMLLMSFSMIVVAYCLTPLPLSRLATLMLTYSAAVLLVCRHTDGSILTMVAAAYALSHLFGAVTAWRLNHRRRETFLAGLREAELRGRLEEALAEVRTLRGMLCICAWCKRIRDEAQAWESVEMYVESRTHASFSHGICPACLQAQEGEMARSGG